MRFLSSLETPELDSRPSEDARSGELLREIGLSEATVRGTTMTLRHAKTGELVTMALPEVESNAPLAAALRQEDDAGMETIVRALRLQHVLKRLNAGRDLADRERRSSGPYQFPITRLVQAIRALPGNQRNALNTFVQHAHAFARREKEKQGDPRALAAKKNRSGAEQAPAASKRIEEKERVARREQARLQKVREDEERQRREIDRKAEAARVEKAARIQEQERIAREAQERREQKRHAESLAYAQARLARGEKPRTREEVADAELLFATYRAKWIATGGHPDPRSFSSFPDTMIKWGMDADATMRKTIEEPGSTGVVYGTGLELFLGVEIEAQRWIEAQVIRIAAVDDYSNSLDLALEFPYDPELGIYPRLAIDFTTATDPEVLRHKLEKQGRGTNVNFFRSKEEVRDGGPFEGRVEDLPIVILGVNGTVLSDVGAAIRRGETIGPDHPIKTVLLRQAYIQVGLQIRELAATFVGKALRNMPTEQKTLAAVWAYAKGFQSGDEFLRDVSAIRDILKTVPADGMGHYLGDHATNRFRHLLSIHRSLESQIESPGAHHPAADEMMKTIRLSQTLQQAEHRPSQTKTSPTGEVFYASPGSVLSAMRSAAS